MRTRSFCLADAHIICSPDQVESELEGVIKLIEDVSATLGLKREVDYRFRLSLGDRADDKKYYKDDEAWDRAEAILRSVLDKQNIKYFEAEKEAAFYGPKIDIQMRNANGKEETAITVQYDFVMPKRFKLTYTDSSGESKDAVVIHRSSIGAIERTVAFLIEKYQGRFPLWLSPTQVKILPITERNNPYARSIVDELAKNNIRVEIDDRNETLAAKIRDAQNDKIPYMLIVGDKEEKNKTISIRSRDQNVPEAKNKPLPKFINEIKTKIENKDIS
jgi:threonyl-tRNA synthetase